MWPQGGLGRGWKPVLGGLAASPSGTTLHPPRRRSPAGAAGGACTGGEGLKAAWPTWPLRLRRGPRRGGNSRVGVAGGQGEEGRGGRQWEGGGGAVLGEDRGAGSAQRGGYPTQLQADGRLVLAHHGSHLSVQAVALWTPPSAIRDDGMEAQGAGAGSLQRPLGQAAASGSTLAELSL